jgi:hypothetical protein
MSSKRRPSAAQLREIVKLVSDYIKTDRRLLDDHPQGSAPNEATHARDEAIDDLMELLADSQASKCYGWAPDVRPALKALTGLIDDFESWYCPFDPVNEAPPHARFNVEVEKTALVKWDKVLARLQSALENSDLTDSGAASQRASEAGSHSATTNREAPPPEVTPRQDLILVAFNELGRDDSGPWQGRVIASKAGLDYDGRLRADLSSLKKLELLGHNDAGYFRTNKPYRCR